MGWRRGVRRGREQSVATARPTRVLRLFERSPLQAPSRGSRGTGRSQSCRSCGLSSPAPRCPAAAPRSSARCGEKAPPRGGEHRSARPPPPGRPRSATRLRAARRPCGHTSAASSPARSSGGGSGSPQARAPPARAVLPRQSEAGQRGDRLGYSPGRACARSI